MTDRMTMMTSSITSGLLIAAMTFMSVRDGAAQTPDTDQTREIVLQDARDRASEGRSAARQPQKTVARPQPAGSRAVRVRVSGHVSLLALGASQTFDATVGSSNAVEYGGSGAVLLPRGFFVEVDFSHVEKDGERVFVDDGVVFGLGIPLTVSMTPIDLTAGYRFAPDESRPRPRSTRRRLPFVPYGGGGVGWLAYKETSQFADTGEDVDERFTSYHVLGGVEVPIWRMLGTAAEARYRWVPDALGESDSSVSEAFDETNLGGFLFRVKMSATF